MGTQEEGALRVDSVRDGLAAEVRDAIAARSGLKASDLKKVLPKAHKKRIDEALAIARELVARGAAHRWVRGRTERFFADDPIETLDRLLPAVLANGPLAEAEVKKAMVARSPNHKELFKEWWKSARDRRLTHPAAPSRGSRTKRFGLEPDPRLALAKVLAALEKILPTLDDAGIDRAHAAAVLVEALGVSQVRGPSRSDRDAFLRALDDLTQKSPPGRLLLVRELRAEVPIDKTRFDETALDLAREGAIVLHHHDFPSSLSAEERSELIEDARGTHYVGIALRSRR
jgi:hypothetical protein